MHTIDHARHSSERRRNASALIMMGVTAAIMPAAHAATQPDAAALLERIEQIQRDSQRQIDQLKQQVATLAAQATPAPVAPPAAGRQPDAVAQTQVPAPAPKAKSDAQQPSSDRYVTRGNQPGFIQIPDSETSFKVSGRLYVTNTYDFTGFTNGNSSSPGPAPGNFAPNRIPVPGFSAAYKQAGKAPGGYALQAYGSGIYVETARDTQFGLLKSLVALDAVPPPQVPVNQSTSNNVTVRLQRAYVTLGPWLIGQDFPNFTPSFRADTADPGPVPGVDWMLRAPQIRYTLGLSKNTDLKLALENPDTDVACYSGGAKDRYNCGTVPTATVPGTVGNTSRGNNGIGSPLLPVFSAKLERSFGAQGLLSGHAMVHQLNVDDGGGHNAKANAWALGTAAWWRVGSRDRVYGHYFFGNGLGHYSGDYYGYSGIYDGASKLELPRQWSAMLGYRHYWTDSLRTSLTYGKSQMSSNSILPDFTEGYVKSLEFGALNTNWELGSGINLFAEYDWGRRTMQTDQSGEGERIATGLRYFF